MNGEMSLRTTLSMSGESSDSYGRSRELMGSLMGMVTTHLDSLSGERLDPAVEKKRLQRTLRSQKSYRPPTVAVIGSSHPATDATTVKKLFPKKFRSEKNQDSVLMIENGTAAPLHLFLVDCQANNGGEMPVHWKNATIVMKEREIKYAMEQCRGKWATLFHLETVEDPTNRYAALAVIRLSGGGNLVLMTSSFLRSRAGRSALTEFVLSRERHEAIDYGGVGGVRGGVSGGGGGGGGGGSGTGAMTRAMRDEDFLKELEDQFDPRYMRRRSSTETQKTPSVQHPVPSLRFPSLAMSLQRKHGFMQNDVPINSSKPITFETDLFAGKMMVLMRPQHPDQDSELYQNFFADNNATVSAR